VSDEKGNYSLSNVIPGSYDIVVELPDGVYVVERTLSVSEAKAYSLSLATVPPIMSRRRCWLWTSP